MKNLHKVVGALSVLAQICSLVSLIRSEKLDAIYLMTCGILLFIESIALRNRE